MSALLHMLFKEQRRKKSGANRSAGKQQVQAKGGKVVYGKTGRRFRIAFRPVKATRAIVKTQYVKNNSDAQRHMTDHIEYIQERDRNDLLEPERTFFDRSRNGIERPETTDRMLALQGTNRAMYKVMLSPSHNDIDHEKYTREWMEALEKHLGFEVDWLAVTHKNTEHHHIHLVIGGKMPEQDRELFSQGLEGQNIIFDRTDLNDFRQLAEELLYKERGLEKEYELNREVEREFGLKGPDQTVPRDVLGQDRLTDEDRRELGMVTSGEDSRNAEDLHIGQVYETWDIGGLSTTEDEHYKSLFEKDPMPDLSAELAQPEMQDDGQGDGRLTNPFESRGERETPEPDRSDERHSRRDDEERGGRE